MKVQKKATLKLKVGERFKVIPNNHWLAAGYIVEVTKVEKREGHPAIQYKYIAESSLFWQYTSDFIASTIELTELEKALL